MYKGLLNFIITSTNWELTLLEGLLRSLKCYIIDAVKDDIFSQTAAKRHKTCRK